MTARWPFRAALGFVVDYQIVGPLVAGEHLRWGWWGWLTIRSADSVDSRSI